MGGSSAAPLIRLVRIDPAEIPAPFMPIGVKQPLRRRAARGDGFFELFKEEALIHISGG